MTSKKTTGKSTVFIGIIDSEHNMINPNKPDGDGWSLVWDFKMVDQNYWSNSDIVYWADIHDLGVKDWNGPIIEI